MTAYYISENNGGLRKAEKLKATNLAAAKREATRKALHYGTRLVIGTEVNKDGFITDVKAVKKMDCGLLPAECNRIFITQRKGNLK